MPTMSEERLAPANGIEIAYQEVGDPSGEPLLLVMGLATQMLGWDEELCGMLAERGFRVVRFDNRDVGHSTMFDSAGVPSRRDLLLGRRASAAYLLSDMAADAIGLMDHLEISSAHVAGVSMGGMIGQALAIEHPERIRSLVSIMSTTGSRRAGQPKPHVLPLLLKPAPREREAFVAHMLALLSAIGAPGDVLDTPEGRSFVADTHDRDPDVRGTGRQLAAILASGDRTKRLRDITAPTLVIHGDVDPLITPSGGKATAKAIPGARLTIVPGMGHGLPERLWPQLVDAIAGHVADAERARASVAAGA